MLFHIHLELNLVLSSVHGSWGDVRFSAVLTSSASPGGMLAENDLSLYPCGGGDVGDGM